MGICVSRDNRIKIVMNAHEASSPSRSIDGHLGFSLPLAVPQCSNLPIMRGQRTTNTKPLTSRPRHCGSTQLVRAPSITIHLPYALPGSFVILVGPLGPSLWRDTSPIRDALPMMANLTATELYLKIEQRRIKDRRTSTLSDSLHQDATLTAEPPLSPRARNHTLQSKRSSILSTATEPRTLFSPLNNAN
jgi:hypothetical protein